jgi:hypothetical protein
MTRQSGRVLLVLAVAAVAGSLLLGDEEVLTRADHAVEPGAAVRAEATRDCASRVEGSGRWRVIRAGRGDVATRSVILHGLRSAERVDLDEAYRPGGGDAVLKAPLSVRGARAIVELVPRGRARLTLDYDRRQWLREGRTVAAGHGQRSVRFVPCPPDELRFSGRGEVGPWTGWNGGLLIATPGCATLRVWRGGRPGETAQVAVGVPGRCR